MDNRVGKRIKSLRQARNYTVRGLAEELSIDYSYLSKMENGKNKPSLDMLEQLSVFFNVDISYFFVKEGNEEKVDLQKTEKDLLYERDLSLENLRGNYNLTVDGEPASDEEIEEMIKYIKALRIMKKPN